MHACTTEQKGRQLPPRSPHPGPAPWLNLHQSWWAASSDWGVCCFRAPRRIPPVPWSSREARSGAGVDGSSEAVGWSLIRRRSGSQHRRSDERRLHRVHSEVRVFPRGGVGDAGGGDESEEETRSRGTMVSDADGRFPVVAVVRRR